MRPYTKVSRKASETYPILSIDPTLLPEDAMPLLVFVNSRSGGQVGGRGSTRAAVVTARRRLRTSHQCPTLPGRHPSGSNSPPLVSSPEGCWSLNILNVSRIKC